MAPVGGQRSAFEDGAAGPDQAGDRRDALSQGGRALVGLESAPMDALGRAGRVERLTIQPRKKTHECYSKGNRRPAK